MLAGRAGLVIAQRGRALLDRVEARGAAHGHGGRAGGARPGAGAVRARGEGGCVVAKTTEDTADDLWAGEGGEGDGERGGGEGDGGVGGAAGGLPEGGCAGEGDGGAGVLAPGTLCGDCSGGWAGDGCSW